MIIHLGFKLFILTSKSIYKINFLYSWGVQKCYSFYCIMLTWYCLFMWNNLNIILKIKYTIIIFKYYIYISINFIWGIVSFFSVVKYVVGYNILMWDILIYSVFKKNNFFKKSSVLEKLLHIPLKETSYIFRKMSKYAWKKCFASQIKRTITRNWYFTKFSIM